MKKDPNQNDNNNDLDLEQGIPLTLYQGGSIPHAPKQSEPLLPRRKVPEVIIKRVAGEASLLDLTREMYQLMVEEKYLDHKDIINLMRVNSVIRRTLLSNLNSHGVPTGISVLATLAPRHKTWRRNQKEAINARQRKRILIEFLLAIFFIILFTSLSMDSFQVPYAATYFAMVGKILYNGTFCQVTNQWGYALKLGSLQLPPECGEYSLVDRTGFAPARATDAPAEYWFATAAPLLFAQISAGLFFYFNFKKNPIAKLISGGAFLAFGSVTMIIPYLVQQGWPVRYAVKGACDAAYQYAFGRWRTECPHAFYMDAFQNIESISPVISAIGENLSPYVIPALSLGTAAGICFFGARIKAKINREIEFHLENELHEPMRVALLEKPKENTRLL